MEGNLDQGWLRWRVMLYRTLLYHACYIGGNKSINKINYNNLLPAYSSRLSPRLLQSRGLKHHSFHFISPCLFQRLVRHGRVLRVPGWLLLSAHVVVVCWPGVSGRSLLSEWHATRLRVPVSIWHVQPRRQHGRPNGLPGLSRRRVLRVWVLNISYCRERGWKGGLGVLFFYEVKM